MDFKAKWQALGGRFDAKSKRERVLIAAAAVGGILLLGNALLVEPVSIKARQMQRQSELQSMETNGLLGQMAAVRAQLQADPDAGRKGEISQFRIRLGEIETALKALEDGFVPPSQMNGVLEDLLRSHGRVRLISLKSMPPTNLAEPPKAGEPDKSAEVRPAGPAPLGLYKHGVELKLEGSYADLYAWLAQVEAGQRKLLWGEVRFSVVEYPRAVMSLTVYTLSTDKVWLAI